MSHRARVLVVILLAAAVLPAVNAQDAAGAPVDCPGGLREVEDIGLACPRPGGVYEVFNDRHESLGFTHGPDPVPPAEEAPVPLQPMAGTRVNCVSGALGTYHIQVIYARATDDLDRYASMSGSIRTMVGQANQLVDNAGIATGRPASLNVKCVNGVVEVKNEVLPTLAASASFSSIVNDLRDRGYNNGRVKYWVFYDDTSACTCGGMGHIYLDDSPSASNLNNGNGGPLFAVTFGYESVRIMLHELGHNMGAVQNSAPHTTGALHCYDGRDTMCYNDGGPSGHLYSNGHCSSEVWDCGHDDYFHTSPAAGSYLARHWNVGSSVNRFITFGVPPVLTSLSCPTSVDQRAPMECSLVATSGAGNDLRYTIDWGDGTTTLIPETGYVAPNVTQTATKTYLVSGPRVITASVVDDEGVRGNTLTRAIDVLGVPSEPPAAPTVTCTPDPVPAGASTTCRFSTTDVDSVAVAYEVDWGDGSVTRVPATGFVAPEASTPQAHAYAASGSPTVTVRAFDDGAPAAQSAPTTRVVMVAGLCSETLPSRDAHSTPLTALELAVPSACSDRLGVAPRLFTIVASGAGSDWFRFASEDATRVWTTPVPGGPAPDAPGVLCAHAASTPPAAPGDAAACAPLAGPLLLGPGEWLVSVSGVPVTIHDAYILAVAPS